MQHHTEHQQIKSLGTHLHRHTHKKGSASGRICAPVAIQPQCEQDFFPFSQEFVNFPNQF